MADCSAYSLSSRVSVGLRRAVEVLSTLNAQNYLYIFKLANSTIKSSSVMKSKLDVEDVERIIERIARDIIEQEDYLTGLDSAIGDGDHGVSMARGFREAAKRMAVMEWKDIGSIFEKVGSTLVSVIGGATGPIFGTFFLKAGKVAEGKEEVDIGDLAAMFEAGLRGVTSLGRAEVGDKTMVDALQPAVMALRRASDEGATMIDAFERAAEAAREGMESTRSLVARKGKASYLGERSLGHPDPGAGSIYLIFKSISGSLKSAG